MSKVIADEELRLRIIVVTPPAGVMFQIERARAAHGGLETEITGEGHDGGPVCATVPLRNGGWRLES